MKILCEWSPNAPAYIRAGWGNAFISAGHSFQFWNPVESSCFDTFTEFKPDVFIGTTYGVDRALAKVIRSMPEMRVALFASAWGPLASGIDTTRYPIVKANAEEKRRLEQLRHQCGKPDFVFIHTTGDYLDGTMSGWGSIGIPYEGILNAADVTVYRPSLPWWELACDVAFVGGYWPYKARNLDRTILPLTQLSIKVRLYGNQRWPVPQFLGQISDAEVPSLFNSATVCPSVCEPHATEFGFDFVERPFKIMACGGFCVSDEVDEAVKHIYSRDELVYAKVGPQYVDTVKHFVNHPEERLEWIKRGFQATISRHTYHHRVAQMLRKFGMGEEADKVMAVLAALTKGDRDGS